MLQLKSFTFNDFLENTYVLWDESKWCLIVDPGCCYDRERKTLQDFISSNQLQPKYVLNTHCHLDHVLGNKWVTETFSIPLYCHADDLFLLHATVATGQLYGIHAEASPEPESFLTEGDRITLGDHELKVLLTPGHSPGSVSFYSEKEGFVLSGDVLFQSSIGRFDLPGGSYDTLMKSINEKLLVLPDETRVYSGHGPVTTIGEEKRTNPFILEYLTAPGR